MIEQRYEVGVAPAVHALLRSWKAAHLRRPQCAEALTYQAVRSAVTRVIANPQHALDSKNQLRGSLAGLCRLKIAPASRWRIIYITSPARAKSIILWIGYRKEGDRRDAYVVLRRMIDAGDFDAQFAELGMKRPE